MATVPSPRTWTVAELLTAAKLNTDVRDGLNFLLAPPRALLQMTGNQSIPNNSHTPVDWDDEQYDPDGGHSNSVNPARYTFQTAGWWEVHSRIAHPANTTGQRLLRPRKNGSTVLPGGWTSNTWPTDGYVICLMTTWVLVSVSDYVEVTAFQNSGVSLTMPDNWDSSFNFMSCKWIGKN